MIKSKLKIYPFITNLALVLFFAICFLIKLINIYKINFQDTFQIIVTTLSLFLYLFFLRYFLQESKIIILENNYIAYRNWLTNRTVLYHISELDGYKKKNKWSKTGSFEIIYLVKDGKIFGGISSLNYSNYEEMAKCITKKLEGIL